MSFTYFNWIENSWRSLQYAVDTVTDVEPVGPVVVGHGPVVGLHGDQEAHHLVVVVPLQTKQVRKHEGSLAHLLHVAQSRGVVGVTETNS